MHVLLPGAAWLTNHNVQRLVLVVCEADSGATLERWQFNLECDRTVKDVKYACNL